jgi:hypothetical protein
MQVNLRLGCRGALFRRRVITTLLELGHSVAVAIQTYAR